MNTIKELAFRLSAEINSLPRSDREFSKNDFIIYQPLPNKIYNMFLKEFNSYTQEDMNNFTKEMNILVDA